MMRSYRNEVVTPLALECWWAVLLTDTSADLIDNGRFEKRRVFAFVKVPSLCDLINTPSAAFQSIV